MIENEINGIINCVKGIPQGGKIPSNIHKNINLGLQTSIENELNLKKSLCVDIAKADKEQQTVTGIVLQPETTDAQGHIYSEDTIRDTAYKFLQNFNKKTKLGIQHKSFPKDKLVLVESYIAPMDMSIGTSVVKKGSWIMTIKVLSKKIWKKIKDGEITGFSIAGKAKAVAIKE